MCSVPAEVPPGAKARWLAELANALDDAQQLLMRLALHPEERAAARELHWRIEAARLEVQSLRVSRSVRPRDEIGPERIESAAW